MCLLDIERGQTPSLYTGGGVSRLYREEADSFSIRRRECPPLYIERIETPSLHKGENVSLLYREEADESVSTT